MRRWTNSKPRPPLAFRPDFFDRGLEGRNLKRDAKSCNLTDASACAATGASGMRKKAFWAVPVAERSMR
jgi:hypothetical protein